MSLQGFTNNNFTDEIKPNVLASGKKFNILSEEFINDILGARISISIQIDESILLKRKLGTEVLTLLSKGHLLYFANIKISALIDYPDHLDLVNRHPII